MSISDAGIAFLGDKEISGTNVTDIRQNQSYYRYTIKQQISLRLIIFFGRKVRQSEQFPARR